MSNAETVTEQDHSNDVQQGKAAALVSSVPSWFAVLIGIAVGIAFMLALSSLWGLADDGGAQIVWDRRFGLYQTLSSLFGAIVGAVFGVGILQPRVNQAEGKAADSEKAAKADARLAAAATAGVEAAVEAERSRILELATMAAKARPQIVVDRSSDDPNSAFRMLNIAADQSGPVNVVRAGEPGQSDGMLSLVDLVDAIDQSRTTSDW